MTLHLLNTAIIPAFPGRATIPVEEISLTEARAMILIDAQEVVSHIGHQSTADLMSGLLGYRVVMDWKPWDGTGTALVCQLNFRAEEGRIYSTEEMAEFSAKGKIVWRQLIITW